MLSFNKLSGKKEKVQVKEAHVSKAKSKRDRLEFKSPINTYYQQVGQGCDTCEDTTPHLLDYDTKMIICTQCGSSYKVGVKKVDVLKNVIDKIRPKIPEPTLVYHIADLIIQH